VNIGSGFRFQTIVGFCSGMWSYLTARANGRTAVELERQRNLGTAEAIKALPPGAELVENEPNGRLRVIRMPDRQQRPPIVGLPPIQPPTIEPPVIQPQAIDQAAAKGELTE